jgi:hypothetical protein
LLLWATSFGTIEIRQFSYPLYATFDLGLLFERIAPSSV